MTHEQSGRRYAPFLNVEVRAAKDGGGTHVEGHAAVFDTPTWIGPKLFGFEERIARGAFEKTLKDKADVRLLFNHNPDLVLARTKSGTLTLREDGVGLAVDADLAPTTVGADLAALLKRGDVDQMSFGFQVVRDRWEREERDGTEVEIRTVLEARLFDVSAVTYPAYAETDLALREAVLARELRGQPVPGTPEPVASEETTDEPPAAESDDELRVALRAAADDPSDDHLQVVRSLLLPRAPLTSTLADPAADLGLPDRDIPLAEMLLRHAGGLHQAHPRVLCPACSKTPPSAGTSA